MERTCVMALDDDERDEDDDVVHGHYPDDPPDESGDWRLTAVGDEHADGDRRRDPPLRRVGAGHLRDQVEGDEDLTAAQRDHLLRRARVFAETTTRATIEAGQTRLQRPQ